MEFIKKYWWALLLAPVVVYFLYKYYQGRSEVERSTARAREAKAMKAALKEVETENTTENAAASTMDS